MVSDPEQDWGFVAFDPVECVTHDLELPFHRAAQQRVSRVLVEGVGGGELFDSASRLDDVMKVRPNLFLHRPEPFPSRRGF